MRLLLVGALALCITTSARACGPVKPQPRATSKEKVAAIFAAMRDKSLDRYTFPDVDWEDIPALLERAPSKARLRHFPLGLSARALEETSEGEVALWLIEGIRTGRRVPVHHPRLNGDRAHVRAVECYFRWWALVEQKLRMNTAIINPLKGTGLRWGVID